jgi:hypothetical protein
VPDLSDQDRAIIQTVRLELEKRLGLTPVGSTYVEKFAAYCLRSNTRSQVYRAGIKRPKFTGPIAQGQYIRQAVIGAVADELRNVGRRVDIGVQP